MTEILYRAAKQSESNPWEYVLSDDSVDRYGDVIDVAGWELRNFKHNPIALFNHNANAIIGTWENVRVEGNRLLGKLKLAALGTSRLVDEVHKHIEQGILKAVSVGFQPLQSEPLTKDSDDFWGPFRYLKTELVEASMVAVPANPNAIQIGKSYLLSADARRQLFGKLASNEARPRPANDPGKLAPRTHEKGTIPMKVSKRIETLQAQLNRQRDQLTALSDLDEPSEEESQLIEQLPTEIEATERDLAMQLRVEKALAFTTEVNDPPAGNVKNGDIIPPGRPFRVAPKKLDPYDFLIRSAAVSALVKITGDSVEKIRQRLYGEDEATAWFVRAVTNPALTTVPGWAAELVQTATAGFLDSLKPNTVFPSLRGRGASFTFGPNSAAIRVPARTGTPTLAGAWVGEGQAIPVRRIGFTSATLGPKKLAVISTFSNELAELSTPNIETVIRDAMETDTALVIDTYLLDDQAATAIRPAGLRNGVAETPPSALTDPTQAMIADMKALVGAIISANGGRDVVIIMNTLQEMGINFAQSPSGFLFPNEGEAGRRFGVSFVSSTAVPVGMVVAVDAADFASASGEQPDFNVSEQATIHEEDTAPLPITTGAQGAAVAATPVRSLWQTDTIGIRMRLPLNWTMRRPGMVAWMDNVLW